MATLSGSFNLDNWYGGYFNGSFSYNITYNFVDSNTLQVTAATFNLTHTAPTHTGSGFYDAFAFQTTSSMPPDSVITQPEPSSTADDLAAMATNGDYGIKVMASHFNGDAADPASDYRITSNATMSWTVNKSSDGKFHVLYGLGRNRQQNAQGQDIAHWMIGQIDAIDIPQYRPMDIRISGTWESLNKGTGFLNIRKNGVWTEIPLQDYPSAQMVGFGTSRIRHNGQWEQQSKIGNE